MSIMGVAQYISQSKISRFYILSLDDKNQKLGRFFGYLIGENGIGRKTISQR